MSGLGRRVAGRWGLLRKHGLLLRIERGTARFCTVAIAHACMCKTAASPPKTKLPAHCLHAAARGAHVVLGECPCPIMCVTIALLHCFIALLHWPLRDLDRVC